MPKTRIACWGEAEKLFAGRDSILRREDCEVLLAASARELLELARRAAPGLILIDQDVAGEEALRLCRELKSGRQTAGIPIVLMGEKIDAAKSQALSSAGVEGILSQPTPYRMSQSLAPFLGVRAREHPRYSLEASARVHVEGQHDPLASRMVDVSLQGAQLEIDHPIRLGSGVTLSLPLPGGEALQLNATVVRIMADPLWGRNRLGLRFQGLEPSVQGRLGALLRSLEEVQASARREAAGRQENPHLF